MLNSLIALMRRPMPNLTHKVYLLTVASKTQAKTTIDEAMTAKIASLVGYIVLSKRCPVLLGTSARYPET